MKRTKEEKKAGKREEKKTGKREEKKAGKKILNVMYLSLFTIADRALQFKADQKYTQSVIECILFFALADGLINSDQYDEMNTLLEKDLKEFHNFTFEKFNFD